MGMPSIFIIAGSWPDGFDWLAISGFVLAAFGLPLAGYAAMTQDIRRYLRSLRRALVAVSRVATPLTPYWTMLDRPPCLRELGLDHACTEEQVLAAYRERVKALHPDRGGDLRQFLRLQRHFEQAMHLARTRAQAKPAERS
jgi:hypothetical protein